VFEKHKSASPKAIPIIFTHKLFRRAYLSLEKFFISYFFFHSAGIEEWNILFE